MELSNQQLNAIKAIYSDYHAGATSADEALYDLELVLNNDGDVPLAGEE
jgi:hypothetical protein